MDTARGNIHASNYHFRRIQRHIQVRVSAWSQAHKLIQLSFHIYVIYVCAKSFLHIMFECLSAFGTSGYSMGVVVQGTSYSSALSSFGKVCVSL